MAKKKKSISDIINDIKKQRDRRDRIVNTIELSHSKAYDEAVEALLKDAKGEIDYDRLDNPEVQHDFVEKMSEHYVTAAKNYLKSDIDTGDKDEALKIDMLMKTYAGVNKGLLRELITKHKSRYTKEEHSKAAGEIKKRMSEELTHTIYSPIKGEHAEDVVKHTGSPEFLDHKRMERDDVITTLETYFTHGTLSPKMFRGASYLKDEHKKYKKAA